jgi:hypothetical protein
VNSPPLAEREFLLLTRCLEDRERSALRPISSIFIGGRRSFAPRHCAFVATTSQSETNK